MELFEKAGIILKPREEIVKRGPFRGSVPKGVKRSAWTGKLQFEWDYVGEGELILTNKRLIAIGKNWEGIVMYPDLPLRMFSAIRETDTHQLLLSLGTKYEIMLTLNDASQWVSAIREQCQKEEPKESEEERKESEKKEGKNR